jgi:heptosyltransferase II
MPVSLLGSAKEGELRAEIASGASNCLNLAGKTSLVSAIACLFATKFVVSNDSGLMHVAAALGVPQVAIFGSSDPRHTPPLSDRAQVLWLKTDPSYQPPLDCAPCFERECPLSHTRCLNDLWPGQVLAALL